MRSALGWGRGPEARCAAVLLMVVLRWSASTCRRSPTSCSRVMPATFPASVPRLRDGGRPSSKGGGKQGAQQEREAKGPRIVYALEDELMEQVSQVSNVGGKKGSGKQGGEKGDVQRRRQQASKLAGGVQGPLAAIVKSQLSRQQLRSLNGVVFDTILMADDSLVTQTMKAQGQAYANMVYEKGRYEHGAGPLRTYIYGGMLSGLLQMKDKIGARNATILQEHYDMYDAASNEERADQVEYCRVERMCKSDVSRIVLAIGRTGFRTPVMDALTQIGWDRRYGRSPRGAQERDLEDWLAALLE